MNAEVAALAVYLTGVLGTLAMWGAFVLAHAYIHGRVRAHVGRGLILAYLWPLVVVKYILWDWWRA